MMSRTASISGRREAGCRAQPLEGGRRIDVAARSAADAPGLCWVWSTGGLLTPCRAEGSDRQGHLVERDGNSQAGWLLDRELVVPAWSGLHEARPDDRDRCVAAAVDDGEGGDGLPDVQAGVGDLGPRARR
jgi:hypothetical protein